MTTFLSILGLIFLFLIVSSIYNSATKSNPENYKAPQSDPVAKFQSLKRLANSVGCDVDSVEREFIKQIDLERLDQTSIIKLVANIREKRMEEAIKFGISPKDTCAALMEEWIMKKYHYLYD